MIYTYQYPSPLGILTLASDGTHLTGLWIEGQKYYASAIQDQDVQDSALPVFEQTSLWLEQYFLGMEPDFLPPLAPDGSPFRRAVWEILLEIPRGQVTTYGAIAAKMAQKTGKTTMSAQAVGGAVGHNPISILIPCHRVVGTNGSLTGYAGGLELKIRLLELEKVDVKQFFIPTRGTAL